MPNGQESSPRCGVADTGLIRRSPDQSRQPLTGYPILLCNRGCTRVERIGASAGMKSSPMAGGRDVRRGDKQIKRGMHSDRARKRSTQFQEKWRSQWGRARVGADAAGKSVRVTRRSTPSVVATHRHPPKTAQCPSPSGARVIRTHSLLHVTASRRLSDGKAERYPNAPVMHRSLSASAWPFLGCTGGGPNRSRGSAPVSHRNVTAQSSLRHAR